MTSENPDFLLLLNRPAIFTLLVRVGYFLKPSTLDNTLVTVPATDSLMAAGNLKLPGPLDGIDGVKD